MPEEKIRVWTIRELMKSAIDHLQKNGFEDARLNVELLLAHTLKIPRIQLYLNFDKPLKSIEVDNFRKLYSRRLNYEPVQYIIGSANFMGLSFDVDTRVLIPRPETETLVEQAILHCQKILDNRTINVLDIGTGSGNVAIAVAKYVKKAAIISVDISKEALEIAKLNAVKHKVESRIEFIQADIFKSDEFRFDTKFDLLLSNPPYISIVEWEQLNREIKEYEPSFALTDGKDGLNFYRHISCVVADILNPEGAIIVEVGFGQADKVVDEFMRCGIQQLKIVRDLQGISRIVSGIYKLSNHNIITLN